MFKEGRKECMMCLGFGNWEVMRDLGSSVSIKWWVYGTQIGGVKE